MYRTFIDYDEEFQFYRSILGRYARTGVLEIGCGTGNLAGRFHHAGLAYAGLDLSDQMLDMARLKHPQCRFHKGDMRNFTVPPGTDSVIITGRTTSYLTTNADVNDTFASANRHLPPGGILCFDSIDATSFIPSISPQRTITHYASSNGVKFRRDSIWTPNHTANWMFDWQSAYFRLDPGEKWTDIGHDESTLRTYTREDMTLFLTLAGFTVVEILDRKTYAFDTFVITARKNL